MGMTNVLNMLCGLALFLYGMHVMGEGLTRASGGKLEGILEKLTKSKLKAVLLGAAVTAVIHSVAAARTMAARRVKRLFFTGIPPLRYRQAYAAAERDMFFSLQNGAKSGIMQKRRIWLI